VGVISTGYWQLYAISNLFSSAIADKVIEIWQNGGMREPIFVHELNEAERKQLETGLHSSDAFVLRHSQVILAMTGESGLGLLP